MAKVMYAKEGALIRENPEDEAKLLMAPLSQGDKLVVQDVKTPEGWIKVTAFGLGNAQVEGFVKVVEVTEEKFKTGESEKPAKPEPSATPEKKSLLDSPNLGLYVVAGTLLFGLPTFGLIVGLVIYFVVSGRLTTLLGG